MNFFYPKLKAQINCFFRVLRNPFLGLKTWYNMGTSAPVRNILTILAVFSISLHGGVSYAQKPAGEDKYPNGFKYITAQKKNPTKQATVFVENFKNASFESSCQAAKDIYLFAKTNVWNKIQEQSEGCNTNVFVSYSDFPLIQDMFIQGGTKQRCTISGGLMIYAKQKCPDKLGRKLDMEFKIVTKPDNSCVASMYENGVTNAANNEDKCDMYSYLMSHKTLIDQTIEKMQNN